jgi:hypothetical protein
MSSSSEDGLDCESPSRTPATSKENNTPEGTVIAFGEKTILRDTFERSRAEAKRPSTSAEGAGGSD